MIEAGMPPNILEAPQKDTAFPVSSTKTEKP